MCSCNSPGCFCISHCHKAAGLPSTHQCLQAVSRRQEVDMVTGTLHEPPTLYFYWFCSSLFSDSVFLCHSRANTFCAIQRVPSSYAGGGVYRLLKSLENVSDLARAHSLFSFSYLPPLPKSYYARFIFTLKALIRYNR